jgi:hypothetical protein
MSKKIKHYDILNRILAFLVYYLRCKDKRLFQTVVAWFVGLAPDGEVCGLRPLEVR